MALRRRSGRADRFPLPVALIVITRYGLDLAVEAEAYLCKLHPESHSTQHELSRFLDNGHGLVSWRNYIRYEPRRPVMHQRRPSRQLHTRVYDRKSVSSSTTHSTTLDVHPWWLCLHCEANWAQHERQVEANRPDYESHMQTPCQRRLRPAFSNHTRNPQSWDVKTTHLHERSSVT